MSIDVASLPTFDPSDTAFILDPARPVLTHARTIAAGHAVRLHSRPRGQLLWATEGVIRVMSHACIWVVPPSHAVWIPGGLPHQMVTETDANMLNLYVDPSRQLRQDKGPKGQGCAVLLLTPLVRELIRRLAQSDTSGSFDARLSNLVEVMLDELENLQEVPLNLPGGQDARLIRLTSHLVSNPADQRPLHELATLAGASPRTLERLFRNETGLTFRQWRSQLRLLAAIEALNQGQSSTSIAWSLGWHSPSAFIAAFRAQFGTTPQKFLHRK